MKPDVFTVDELKWCAEEGSRKAVSKTHKSGGILTFQRGKEIIKQYPDGTEEVLQVLDKAYFRPKKMLYKIG